MKRVSGQVAWPDGSVGPGRIEYSDRIATARRAAAAPSDYIIPGFIDLQVNGADWTAQSRSVSIDVAVASAAEIRRLAARMAAEGTVAFLPTMITSALGRIEQVDREIVRARDSQIAEVPRTEAAIVGLHLEGPFIAATRRGAHQADTLLPRGAALERILALRSIRLITLAPELPGALDAIAQFNARGIVVSMGHSGATLEQARAALDAGARMFTHLFNAMRPMNHRDPGIAAAGLEPSTAFTALIPDGVHVHQAMLALAVRARGPAGIILTTDRRAIGRDPLLRAADGAARLADGTLAGSAITMLDGVRTMVERAGVALGEAARMASANPASLLGLTDRGRITRGARADLVVLDHQLRLKSVIVGGVEAG
jgi:N-acetylglucosamine-6-phosphate deacetylase